LTSEKNLSAKKPRPNDNKDQKVCDGCGKAHPGGRDKCRFTSHPDYNKQGAWTKSETFKRLQSISDFNKSLKRYKKLEQKPDGNWILVDNPNRQVKSTSTVSTVDNTITYNISHLYHDRHEDDKYVTAFISGHTLKTLLDTGALEENFISSEIVQQLKLKTFKIHMPIYVMSVHGKECINKYVILNMNLRYNEERVTLPSSKFLILDKGPAPITIGLPDIRRHDITNKLRAFFAPSMRMEEQKETPGQRSDVSQAPLLQAYQIRTASKDMFLDPVVITDPIDDVPEDIWTTYFQSS
jgi:hypothetical protein